MVTLYTVRRKDKGLIEIPPLNLNRHFHVFSNLSVLCNCLAIDYAKLTYPFSRQKKDSFETDGFIIEKSFCISSKTLKEHSENIKRTLL